MQFPGLVHPKLQLWCGFRKRTRSISRTPILTRCWLACLLESTRIRLHDSRSLSVQSVLQSCLSWSFGIICASNYSLRFLKYLLCWFSFKLQVSHCSSPSCHLSLSPSTLFLYTLDSLLIANDTEFVILANFIRCSLCYVNCMPFMSDGVPTQGINR